ncbi:MAG: hypothetical protein LBG62_04770 [Candidatus Methanoplasma sp.]|jgi:hypothetical protein|nr:hypothetical protein [Candidatus Methanoplasma sp.]
MKDTPEVAEYLIDITTAKVAEIMARESGRTTAECMREFMSTRTFEVLDCRESYLYHESVEYVLDMLDDERRGDFESWREI